MTSSSLAFKTAHRRAARNLGDSFATGVLVMLLVNVIQRGVGLVRGIGFCRFLDDAQLGQWSLANSFFVIGVPIAALGLPGSFGKFTEYFRSRQLLSHYFWRVLAISSLGLCISCGLMLYFHEDFSWLILGQSNSLTLMLWMVLAFACVSIFSFVNELASSLRQVCAVSLMQFTQSLVFAIVGLWLVASYQTWFVLLPSFAIACLLGCLPGLWIIHAQHASELVVPAHAHLASSSPAGNQRRPGSRSNRARKNSRNALASRRVTSKELPSSSMLGRLYPMLQRILPYAGMLWMMNFLANLFEVSDRYMLLHLSQGGEAVGQALVGQYHAGFIFPNLLISFSLMLSGILLPYLSADWESERRPQIITRLRQMLQCVSVGFTMFAVVAMCLAPWLYGWVFDGRYQSAERVLPIALLQAIWISLFFVGQTYLLCAERGRQLVGLLCAGLAVNLCLNWLLIQHFGLAGALMATASANLVLLMLLLLYITSCGERVGLATLGLCSLPICLLGGPLCASLTLFVVLLIAGRTNLLLSNHDRSAVDALALPRLGKLGIHVQSLWP